MSKLIVEVKELRNVRHHPNADKLDLADVGGWQVVVGRDKYKDGDYIIFIPPDAVLPWELHNQLGVTNYLAEIKGTTDRRVKATRLRNEPSYGLVVDMPKFANPLDEEEFYSGISEFWGITKWEPPVMDDGESIADHPMFHRYTDIERWQNYPDMIPDGELVVITEKIHGTNSRVGIMPTEDGKFEFVVGSHSRRRKIEHGIYAEPLKNPNVVVALEILFKLHKQPIIIFGEIFGDGVQDMKYGLANGQKGFRIFDISVGGEYLSYNDKKAIAARTGLELVPQLYRGPMSAEIVKRYTDGETTFKTQDKFVGREGIVITPQIERRTPAFGRVILKSISADYYNRKGATDGH